MKLDINQLLKLYELQINEGHVYLKVYENRIGFYSGLISAIIGGIIYSITSFGSNPIFPVLLIAELLLLAAISQLAIIGTDRQYRQLLENITVRAKIEIKLGLTESITDNKIAKEINWESEPIVAPRHLKSREEYRTSERFINDKLGKGYNYWPRAILRGIQIFCGIAIIIVLTSVYWQPHFIRSPLSPWIARFNL